MEKAVYVFPAIRGRQAQREYYVSMVPLEIIPRIFQFSDEELPPEIRAQRTLNKTRIPEMRDYILDHLDSYVFSSLTVSVDGELEFVPVSTDYSEIGNINISMNSRFLINDGQHRRAAIAEALKKRPELKNEHISVVFFRDDGLRKSQQIFSDLNRYAIRPTRSINILYNNREEYSLIAKEVCERVKVFSGMTDKEHTAISNRSRALFTLSAICTSTTELLSGLNLSHSEKTELASDYWTEVSRLIKPWNEVKAGTLRSSVVRSDFVCSLGLTLVALGKAGNRLLKLNPIGWRTILASIENVDWRKSNPIWENMIFINGSVVASRSTQNAMTNYFENLFNYSMGDQK
jgi:DNA sulfur modification protein DndB